MSGPDVMPDMMVQQSMEKTFGHIRMIEAQDRSFRYDMIYPQ